MAKKRAKKKTSKARSGTPKRKSPRRPVGERGKETETRILDAGEVVFARLGFAGSSTQEIAAAAGVTKAMIHYYFDSKERLYRAVLDRILFELIRLVQEVTVAEEGRVQRLENFIFLFVDFVARHPHFGRLTTMGMGSEGRYFEGIVTTFFRPLFQQGVEFIEEGIAEGEFRQVDAPQLLLSIYNVAMGYCADAHFISLMTEEDALGEERLRACRTTLRDMVFRYLGLDGQPERA